MWKIATTLVPGWARLLVIFGGLLAIWVLGDIHGHTVEERKGDLELARQKEGFDASIATAKDALIDANNRAAAAGQGAVTDQAAILAAYTKGKADESKAADARANARVADMLASGKRVRVDATCRTADAGGGIKLPGPAAPAGGANGTAAPDVELSPEAVGRLSAASDKIIGALNQRIIALQATAQSEHDRCNQVGTQPAAVDPARKRFPVLR